MRVAVVCDIHGNLPALEAVLGEVRDADVDRIVVGGDLYPGPMSSATLDRLLNFGRPIEFVVGNGEMAVLAELAGSEYRPLPETVRQTIRWTAQQLGPDDARFVASWPKTLRLEIPELGSVLFCHGTPRDEDEIFTRTTSEDLLRPLFDPLGVTLIVCGHTHMQFDRQVGKTRVVNAGSVGMPFGSTGADWLLLGPDVQLRHTTYDLERAAERIRQTGYPQANEFADRYVLNPPTEAEILKAFSVAELKGIRKT
jgi:putative phosphoesterase